MLDEFGLTVQECYTVQWRESKYTLIHLYSRIRHSTLEKKMNELNEKYSIIQTEIIGYESMAGNCLKTELEHHPGFRKMVELANKKCPSLHAWMKEKDIFTNKKGLLWQFIEVPPDQATPSQMKLMLTKWKPMIQEYESIKPAYGSLHASLGRQRSEWK